MRTSIHARAGRLVRAPGWPLVVLVLVALLLFAGSPATTARGHPLAVILAAGVVISAVAWLVSDAARDRFNSRVVLSAITIAMMVVAGGAIFLFEVKVLRYSRTNAAHIGAIAASAVLVGTFCRLVIGRSWRSGQLLVAAAAVSWAAYLDITILVKPFRDASLYLVAGRTFLDGRPVYITAPLTSIPADWTQLPFLYPPFTLPLFAGLTLLPHALAIAILEVLCVVAVVAGLRLLGIRWAFVPMLLCWPPLAIGIQVGNVACFGFLVLAAAWRFAFTVPLGGVFKAQTGVLSLWLVRERRWRALARGTGAIVALGLVTLPLTGVQAYVDWFHALTYFQASLTAYPSTMGIALQRWLGPLSAVAITAGAVAIALLGRRRDGLARASIATVVASPTVYLHGLSMLVPALLMLDAASAWGILMLAPWGRSAWWGAAAALAALVVGLTRDRLAAADSAEVGEGGGPPFDAAYHPLGRLVEPWPDRGLPDGDLVPQAGRSRRDRYRLALGRGVGGGTGDGV